MAHENVAAPPNNVEIITFEYNQLYGWDLVPLENAVEAFIKQCQYMNKDGARFLWTAKTIAYSETEDNDKARTVMMVCTVTDELVARVLKGISARQVVK